ncbi:hypothetical protein A3E35_00860 [Candidatus Giovannonibacteria bacterium RIFCSPHIGHO2_12_FULL_44_22]|nr:MAG: hypothetical protein A3E35_00860 [Candidatus Giovannonibacteria bacterium RIFCSPHIGHO2_12_FULL_44_22]
MTLVKGGILVYAHMQTNGAPRKVADEIFGQLQKAGRNARLRVTGVDGKEKRKRVFKITVLDARYGLQIFVVGLVGGILLEGNGERSIEEMKRVASLN